MRTIALLLCTLLLATPAGAQPRQVDRNYTVTGYDRIRIDGGLSVSLVTNTSPFARASGTAAALDGLDIRVEGRTLIIRQDSSNWSGFAEEREVPVTIEVGTHEIEQAWVVGAGSLSIDRVRGLEFGAAVQGSGQLHISELDVDQIDITLNGAASARLGGEVEDATFLVRGVSALQAADLEVTDLTLGVDGAGVVVIGETREARIEAIGPGDITIGGRPACTARLNGSVTVRGCSR
ncbi:GIN domain-containing protein [Sphingomicrobium sediminis]|uniref:DUF2807 domain-containing protein n=1 Tax=Sphingomicrobium sediminis TaxID=2950949 RepID=A0A9X2J544_9SPHN|nr:DUF2807 domain-containing protein [Sphingomicrobium sediminis]MCM8557877.1 DUF2807 domain-containing protein [Sphingomicrobium sediminis]